MKYFIFNKSLDYERGRMEGCEYAGGALRLKEGVGKGIFVSRVLDGIEKDLVWHRLEMALASPSESCIRVTVYTAENDQVWFDGKEQTVGGLIADRSVPAERLLKEFYPHQAYCGISPENILLHRARGRYLWLTVELFRQGQDSPEVSGIKLTFPKETWLDSLPGIYRKDGESGEFLERYLGIFQNIYGETEEKIRSSHRLLDVEGTGPEFLKWLAGWLDTDSEYLWEEGKLRRLLKDVVKLYGMRGTRQGLLSMITLYTGSDAYIVETFQTEELISLGYKGEQLERLYGRGGSRVYLMVPEEAVLTAREYQALSLLARDMIPAHMELIIIPLKPYLLLGSYSYLGINSCLGQYRPLRLDGLSLLSFTAVGERRGEER